MSGPPPRDTRSRRRRNLPTGGDWITLPAEPYNGPVPALPSTIVDGKRPLTATVTEWDRWWRSPMAHMWDESDHGALLTLIRLIELFNRTGDLKLAQEIRLQQDQFGLTPKSRRTLRWRLPTDDLDELTDADGTRTMRFANLRVVDDGGGR